jgi:hypothetical protein
VIKLVRRIAGNGLLDRRRNEDILEKLSMDPIEKK